VQNGTFVLTNSGILSYAKTALSNTNYAQFANLLSNGSLSGGTFQLNASGVSSLAQTALTQDYQNFQTLYANGSLVNGVWTLTAAGIAAFRQAAATTQNPNPTDAQVQTYANALYQSYAANINGAANVQYQGYLTSISTAASTAYRNFASELLAQYNQYNPNNMIAITDLLGPTATYTPANAMQFLQTFLFLLPNADRTAFSSLMAQGQIQSGTFVLSNVASYAQTGLSATNYSAYNALLAAGTLSNGVLSLSPAGLNGMAQAQLTPNYQSYVNLTSNGSLQSGNFVFSSAGVFANAQAGVTAAYNSFQQLMTNGAVVNGVFTLSSSGLSAYTPIAAAALGIASPTALQVQTYANQQYQNSLFSSANPIYQSYAQSISSGAQTQYTALANKVFLYLQEQDRQGGCHGFGGCSGPILTPGQTTATDAQVAQYASQALFGTDLQNYQTLTANGTVSNGVLTLNAAGLAPVSAQVLSAPLATAFTSLLSTGSLQGGQFVLSSAAVLQNLQTLATGGSAASGLFQFNTAGILANASTALGSNPLQQLLASGSVQTTTVNGVSSSSFVLSDPGVNYYAAAALTAANYLTLQGLTASANGEVVNGVLTLSAAGIAQFSAATAAALHLGTTAPTAAQVQAYANSQYQGFATTIKTYANSQYQSYGNTFSSYANGQYQPLQQEVLNYATNNLNIVVDLPSGTYRTSFDFSGTCQYNNCSQPAAITNAKLAEWAQAANQGTTNSPFGGNNGYGTMPTVDYNSFIAMLGQGTVQNGTLTLSQAALQSYYANPASTSSILNQSYQVFQTIVGAGNSTIQNGTLTLTSAGITNVAAAAAAFLGYNPTNAQVQAFAAQSYVTDLASIQGYAATQYQSYATSISAYGNTQYQGLVQTIQNYASTQYQANVTTIQAYGNSQYQALTANGTPQVSAGILSLVANSVYSTGQIVSTLSNAALLPSAGTVGTNVAASVVGRNVTLNAGNSVGSTAPSVSIGLTDLKNGTITTTQQAALSVATTPGSITFSATVSNQVLAGIDLTHLPAGVTVNGNTLSGLTLGNLPNGVTVTDLNSVELAQTAPLFVNASGTFNATAGAALYVQAAASEGHPVASLTIGQITAGGDVTLLAPQSILAATNSSGASLYANQVVINPTNGTIGNLTMAATNAIGSAANAFTYHISGKLVSAQAGTDAYLTATGGDAIFGKVFATNTVSLTATNGNIDSYLAGVTMAANNIILNASGDVGTQNTPFTVQVGATGLLSGTIAGSGYFYSPTLATQNPVSLNVGSLTAASGLTLISDAGISFSGAAGSSQGSVTVCSGPCLTGSTAVGGSITMSANASILAGQSISLTAPGDIVLGQLTSNASPSSTAIVITVNSTGGTITANGDGHTNITAMAANAEASLAASSIGNSTQRLSVNTSLLTATASTGGIYLSSVADLDAVQLSATHGSVDIVSSGKLTLDSVLAGTATGASGTITAKTLTHTGDVVIGSATSSGNMTVDSAGALRFTQLGITAGAVGLTAYAAVNGGTVDAAAGLGITSTTDSITLATASSGGSQSIRASQNVTFNGLTTTGITGDVGNINVTATNGFVLAQTVPVNGTATLGSVAANGSASLTSGTTNTGRLLTTTTGSALITGGGLVDWTSLTTAATLGVTSTADSIILATAGSGGSQSIHASQNVTFNGLTTTGITGDIGNITVNATNGFILAQTVPVNGTATLGSVAANGSASLTSGTTNTGRLLTTTTGSASITGGGLVDWTSLTTATTLGVTSTADSIILATAGSGGSQSIRASQNVTFNSLTTTGINGDVGNITVVATNGFVLAQTMPVNGTATLGSVAANGSASLTSATTNTGRLLTTTTGSASITSGGLVDWTSLTTATTLGVTSTADSIILATASSGGSQSIHASQNVTFNGLTATGITGDAGSINVTADHGFILAPTVTSGGVTTQGSVAANGSAALVASTTITGNTLAATTGSGLLTAGGPINWNTLNVGTTLGASASQGSITFQTAHSGGTQTIHAHDAVTFNALTATGITGDVGSINVTADNGFILAQTVPAGGAVTQGSVAAHGSATLIAALSNTGHNLTTTTGNAILRGTVVRWDNLNVGGSLGVTATSGGITLGTAVSGGTQTLHAVTDIAFNQLTTTGIPGDAGDINLTSDTGALRGGSISANGDTHFDTAGPIALDRLRGSTIKLSSRGDLTIGFVSVVKELDLAANTINVKGEQIPSTPPIPLIMNVTGYNGGTATSANISLDPDTIVVNRFNVVDANFLTDARAVSILNGYVPGQLILTTATEQVLLNNRSPAPAGWPSLQLYQPGGVFTMSQVANANVSNTYVVFYSGDMSATVTNYAATHTCCNDYTGASMVRNIAVDGEGFENIDTWLAQKSVGTFYQLGLSGHARLDALLTPRPVETVGSGPAVNIEGLSDMRKLRRHGQRTVRPGWKDAAIGVMTKPATSRLAEAW